MDKKFTVLILLILGLAGFLILQSQNVFSQANRQNRGDRFRHNGVIEDEDRSVVDDKKSDATEAPTGFDNLTNGFTEQGAPFETLNADNVVALRSFNDNRFIFEEVETIQDGVGPTYNAQSCRECHQNVVTGGASQVAELRSGRTENGQFFESLGGTLIHSRATYPDIVEQITPADSIRSFRISTNTLGNGFVEAIANSTLLAGEPCPHRALWLERSACQPRIFFRRRLSQRNGYHHTFVSGREYLQWPFCRFGLGI